MTNNRDSLINTAAVFMLKESDYIMGPNYREAICKKFGLTEGEFDQAFSLMESAAEYMYFKSHPELNP